jgi:hypothetical protein
VRKVLRVEKWNMVDDFKSGKWPTFYKHLGDVIELM